jgi:hypothetical protein
VAFFGDKNAVIGELFDTETTAIDTDDNVNLIKFRIRQCHLACAMQAKYVEKIGLSSAATGIRLLRI